MWLVEFKRKYFCRGLFFWRRNHFSIVCCVYLICESWRCSAIQKNFSSTKIIFNSQARFISSSPSTDSTFGSYEFLSAAELYANFNDTFLQYSVVSFNSNSIFMYTYTIRQKKRHHCTKNLLNMDEKWGRGKKERASALEK